MNYFVYITATLPQLIYYNSICIYIGNNARNLNGLFGKENRHHNIKKILFFSTILATFRIMIYLLCLTRKIIKQLKKSVVNNKEFKSNNTPKKIRK